MNIIPGAETLVLLADSQCQTTPREREREYKVTVDNYKQYVVNDFKTVPSGSYRDGPGPGQCMSTCPYPLRSAQHVEIHPM